MKILYFNNGSGLGVEKSGGTTRLIEISKNFIKKSIPVTIVTTRGAFELFKKEKLNANFVVVRSSIFRKKETNNLQRIWSYLISTIHSCILIFQIPSHDVVYSPSDYICDIAPSCLYKIVNPGSKFVAMVHHLCRHPNERLGNKVVNYLSFYFQRLSFLLISMYCDQIYLYDTPEGRHLSNSFFKNSKAITKFVANGVNLHEIKNSIPCRAKYEALFAGGFRASKGIFDLPYIWRNVVNEFPGAKLAIAGAGTDEVTKILVKDFYDLGLSNNVDFLGALQSSDLYSVLRSSQIFVSTSYEEGWGISVFEALGADVPVIAYDLPAFGIIESLIQTVPIGDKDLYIQNILNILRRKSNIKKETFKNEIQIESFDWAVIAEKELKYLRNIVN